MQLLFIHADHLEFEARREAGDDVAEREGAPMAGRMEDCLAVFVSVEGEDESDPDAVVANAVDELRDVADRLNTRKLVLYPSAHLSDDLAGSERAAEILQGVEAELGEFEVLRAPVGWYKSFEVACKGHPLSELSRHVNAHREAPAEERAPSEWEIVTSDGDRLDPIEAKAEFGDDMRALIEAEVEGETAGGGEEPPHLDLLVEKSFAGDDGLSDVDNLRWYPRGKLVRDALIDYVNDLVVEYGGMPVETPVTYDLGARSIRERTEQFGDRQYCFESGGRRTMLRSAACVGQLSILRDMHVSASDLPLRLYETSTYSVRRKQQGEVVGLNRQRASTVPDVHTATADADGAREEFERQATLSLASSADLGVNYEGVLRLTRAFHEEHREWVEGLVARLDRPVLLELVPERRHYWSARLDFVAIDGLGRPIENPTVQIDVESAERFDITYSDGEEERHPPILHCSPSGGIEHVIAVLLENAAEMESPRLPTWLSPTQVRFVPVADEHVASCDELVAELSDAGIRADVDDRDETVGRRIARAETDWVPYYVVVGDREVEEGTLGVNVRARGEEREMDVAGLRATVLDEIEGLPMRPRYLPRHLSAHPNFTGR